MMKSMQWSGVIASLVSLVALSGCSGDAAKDEGGPGGDKPMAVELMGSAAYTVLGAADAMPGTTQPPASYATCSACHQANGQGFAGIAPEIRHTPSAYASHVVRNGLKDDNGMATSMTAYPATTTDPIKMPAISDADLQAIITWSNSLPRPTTPEGLYKDFCGNCHGPTTPTGGQVPVYIKDLPAASVKAAVRAGFNVNMLGNRDEYMPAFDATLLPDADLALILQFIGAK